jgi:hypothetical protein
MKIIETENYIKIAGKKERGKRDGSGPFEGSFQDEEVGIGKRKQRREKCPLENEDKDKTKEMKKKKK